MTRDGGRLLIADEIGVAVVELDDEATNGTVVARLRDPSFRDTAGGARVDDRYLVVNAAWNHPPAVHRLQRAGGALIPGLGGRGPSTRAPICSDSRASL